MSKQFSKMMESASRVEALNLMQLNESNIEKAEIVLAVKGEIVDKLQRQAEVINNMGVDVLGPLLDRIKAEHGVEAAESFRNNISGLLDHAVKTIMDVKDKISTETLKLTGDITSSPDVADLGSDAGMDDISMDVDTPEGDFDFEDDAELGDVALPEPTPMDREMKESVQPKRFGIQLESVKGTVGNKYFDSKAEMQTWLKENENKIAKVLKILK
ncbi:virion structural protein [Pectobacterium phage vB_PcaM_CBB]|uniref:Structural protein n=1 Tax=Pectobacterium phage vB_PcaM_CBB TaxID=2772511 RepID=A0A1L2CV07_9CAUD|nr:virion structural protein [Pectobacterium phage vB_PcaM_CBB]AMM43862.1 structural protein [Pectobacterium phage vB_PcaM_CBB]